MYTEAESLRAVVDAAPAGAALVAADGTLLLWNTRAEELTGWRAEDVIGGLDPSVPPEDEARTTEVLRDWVAAPEHGERTVVRRLRPDGTAHHLVLERVGRVPLVGADGLIVWFGAVTDIDALLLQRNQLSRRLVGATRGDEVVPVLTSAVRELLGADAAVVLRRCPDGDHVHGLYGLGVETEVAESIQLDLDEGTPWRGAVDGWIGSGPLALDGRTSETVFVPMGPDGDGWVLALAGAAEAMANSVVRDLGLAVADEAWVALERASLVSDLDGKIEILEATNRLARTVGLEFDDALAAVTRLAAEALSCERAAVYLVDPDSGELSLAHVYANDAAHAALVAEADGVALADEVVRTKSDVLFQDVSLCGIADGPWHVDQGSVAVMGLPMRVGGTVVGALVVAHTVAHPRGFTSLCQQVGAAVSQQAALTVEHARLFQAERDNVRRLRELDRMKADWMAGVTHDLRAPLTGLLGFVETLRRMTGHVSADKQREYLSVMSRQAAQLVSLVEDLLLSARVDAQAVARRRELVGVDELVDETVSTLTPEERGRLTVSGTDISTPVLADRSHIRRVLQNLLTNAWRHGGTEVEISIGHEAGEVLVAVQDDGPGVEPEARDSIFERFVHGGHEASSGLGLYVARGIVEAHDGTLVLADRPDGLPGARFELRLPRGRPQREQDLTDRQLAQAEAEAEDRRRSSGVAL